MDEEKEDDWVELARGLYFHASRNLDGENSNRDAIKRLDGLFPYTIDAWLHVSGQERLSEVLKIGNMAKQQFCSSPWGVELRRLHRKVWKCSRDPRQSEDTPGLSQQTMQVIGVRHSGGKMLEGRTDNRNASARV
jgi:hypothetical protein